MPAYERVTDLPAAREDVYRWLARPGALVRLFPPFAGRVLQEPSRGVEVGSEARLEVHAPGSLGLAAASAAGLIDNLAGLPARLRPAAGWTARHTEHEPGRVLTDEAVSGPFRSWVHRRELSDHDGGTRIRDRVEYELPPPAGRADRLARRVVHAELERQFDYRARQLEADLAFHRDHGRLASQAPGGRPVVAVTGASGLIGAQVCALLGGAGCEVRRLVRREPHGPGEIRWDPEGARLEREELRDVDVVVNLAGHPLAGRFTAAHKRRILSSRRRGTALLARALARLEREDGAGRALLTSSAIGYYGATPAEQRAARRGGLREEDPPGTDFLARVCTLWEEAARPAAEAGVRVALVRTGIVQTPAGGALQQMLPLFLAGAGGPLGRAQWHSWIGVDDIAALLVHLALDDGVDGPVNGVAPEPVTALDYARTLAETLRRPAALPVPRLGPRLLLGREGAREMAEADQLVAADRALATGYRFRHRDLGSALRHVLGA